MVVAAALVPSASHLMGGAVIITTAPFDQFTMANIAPGTPFHPPEAHIRFENMRHMLLSDQSCAICCSAHKSETARTELARRCS